jgi:hypothetical protein
MGYRREDADSELEASPQWAKEHSAQIVDVIDAL